LARGHDGSLGADLHPAAGLALLWCALSISTGPAAAGRVCVQKPFSENRLWRTSLQGKFTPKRDYYAGALMLLLGVGAAVTGSGYKFGSLARMGPGFMPVVLGVVLALLGLLIAGTALLSTEPDDKKFLPDHPQWFGWLCIIGGPVLFIILGQYGGMIPAVFACVFVCALGDKTATAKSSAILAAGITVFGVLLFHYLLNIPFPLLRGVNL